MEESVSKLQSVLSTLPTIDVGNSFGTTDYIDYLKHSDLYETDCPAASGKDSAYRSFVVFSGEVVIGNLPPKPFMQTFFQRYTGENIWMACGHAEYPQFISTIGGAKPVQIDLITTLLKNEIYEIEGEPLELTENLRLTSLYALSRDDTTCPLRVVIRLLKLPPVSPQGDTEC